MKASRPCDQCGCTEVNLHDGFYFCTECGTQDNNFLETIVEVIEAASGGILHGHTKKIHKIVGEKKEMSDTWYKWHAFNFLLKGTADELVEFGVNPTFKTKLLWVWMRFIKKYMNKDEMGLNENPHNDMPDEEEDSDSDKDLPPEDLLNNWDANRDKLIKHFTFNLLIALLFIALNLDKSNMTLTHLMKIARDGLLSVPDHIERIIPEELKPRKLRRTLKIGMHRFKARNIRIIAMTLFKRLELGNPIVPDLRLIIDNHLKELCLPTDLKPLVLSLMHYKPCSFLDVNSKDNLVYKLPAYEFHIMTYIIWAMKLCLGLDCDYEVTLSKAAEAINEKEDHPKSYYINGESAPTQRLFSFREWVQFYQFRMILLRHYCYRFANKCSWDTDDYIALEHHLDLLQTVYDKNLKDEMAYDLLQRIKGGEVKSLVIPKTEFKPTLTPFHTYTQVLIQHLQDPEVKLKLMEDFTQYSLKYVIDDWNLVNPNSRKKKNLIKGIKVKNNIITNEYAFFQKNYHYSKKMVYVRNCENHNWLTTKPPTLDHLVNVDKIDRKCNDKNDQDLNRTNNYIDSTIVNNNDIEMKELSIENGLDSKSHSISEISLQGSTPSRIQHVDETKVLESKLNDIEKRKINESIASNTKFPDIVSDCSFTNSTISSSIRFTDDTKVFESDKLDETEKNTLREMHDKMMNSNEIQEENEGVNIFDDDFKHLIKEELEEYSNCGMSGENPLNPTDHFEDVSISNNQAENINDNDSDASSLDSVNFDEATFDRSKTIKEIILYMCAKHKLPIPPEYKLNSRNKKEMGAFSRRAQHVKYKKNNKVTRNQTHERQRSGAWRSFVTDYHAAMHEDVLNQIAQQVHLAIQNVDTTQQVNEDPPLDDTVPIEDTNADENMDVDVISNHSDNNKEESDENRLFSEESDGETHAKDLLPKKHPDFDEEVYDASQLYVKVAKPADDGEMELDRQLFGIIDKKMIKDAKDPSLLTWTEERKKLERPDSEDEIPLSVLQELIKLTQKLSEQSNETLEPFVKDKVENFQYWFRFYIGKNIYMARAFEKEIMNVLPKSFTFLLRQCAHILSVSEGDLYRNLQYFEKTAVEKSSLDLKQHKDKYKSDDY